MHLSNLDVTGSIGILRKAKSMGYLTLLPSRDTLQAKLHESIALARAKLIEQGPLLTEAN